MAEKINVSERWGCRAMGSDRKPGKIGWRAIDLTLDVYGAAITLTVEEAEALGRELIRMAENARQADEQAVPVVRFPPQPAPPTPTAKPKRYVSPEERERLIALAAKGRAVMAAKREAAKAAQAGEAEGPRPEGARGAARARGPEGDAPESHGESSGEDRG